MKKQTERSLFLFGELHGEKPMYESELAAWQHFYHTHRKYAISSLKMPTPLHSC